ncbi:MAG: hypothetical protein H7A33_06025 [Deltaproteobacteria bacterium]|nr:hypothetical protein [Deltaproteobacteria bacterium]
MTSPSNVTPQVFVVPNVCEGDADFCEAQLQKSEQSIRDSSDKYVGDCVMVLNAKADLFVSMCSYTPVSNALKQGNRSIEWPDLKPRAAQYLHLHELMMSEDVEKKLEG